MPTKSDLQSIFARLKRILQKYAKHLTVAANKPGNYSLDGAYSEKYKKDIFFGAVQIKKNYVSFYLMPMYAFPELLKSASPALKKRMQGKSCFNFTSSDHALFRELAALTEKGYEQYRKERWAPVKKIPRSRK